MSHALEVTETKVLWEYSWSILRLFGDHSGGTLGALLEYSMSSLEELCEHSWSTLGELCEHSENTHFTVGAQIDVLVCMYYIFSPKEDLLALFALVANFA